MEDQDTTMVVFFWIFLCSSEKKDSTKVTRVVGLVKSCSPALSRPLHFSFLFSLSNKFGFSHFSGCWGSAGQSQNRTIRQDGVGGTLTCRRIVRGERKHVTKRELSVATLCALLGDSQSFASVEWQSVSFSVSLLAFRIVV